MNALTDRAGMRRMSMMLRRMPWLALVAYYVYRWRMAKFSAGAVGVVLDDMGKVLLVEHVFHPQTPWGLPGGWVEREEDPAETVRREIWEELQLTVEVRQVLLLKIGRFNHMDIAFLCQPTGSIGKLSRELLDFAWTDPQQLPRLHSFHYTAIQRALEQKVK